MTSRRACPSCGAPWCGVARHRVDFNVYYRAWSARSSDLGGRSARDSSCRTALETGFGASQIRRRTLRRRYRHGLPRWAELGWICAPIGIAARDQKASSCKDDTPLLSKSGTAERVRAQLSASPIRWLRLYWGYQFMQDGWGKLPQLDKVLNLDIVAPAQAGATH